MDSKNLKDKIVALLEDKKAHDVEAIHVRDKTILADYFVVASGTSNTQVKSLMDEVLFKVERDLGLCPQSTENDTNNRWNLLDYGDVIVHIFHQEEREFYNLEKFWHGSLKVDAVDS